MYSLKYDYIQYGQITVKYRIVKKKMDQVFFTLSDVWWTVGVWGLVHFWDMKWLEDWLDFMTGRFRE